MLRAAGSCELLGGPEERTEMAEQRGCWDNGDLVPLDDGAFRDSLRRDGANLFV